MKASYIVATSILSLFLVFFSFYPTFYEIIHRKEIPQDRVLSLEHNYMYDYNFYLSRIREGGENRWTVVEKYYSQPHKGSLFQIFYLLAGKVGYSLYLEPPVIYHSLRIIMGFTLLMLTAIYIKKHFSYLFAFLAFTLSCFMGSFPVLVKVGDFYRFGTYMGWWSAIDSMQRVTFLPHVLFGQIGIVILIWYFSSIGKKGGSIFLAVIMGLLGFCFGLVFPPTLIVLYTFLVLKSILELFYLILKNKFTLLELRKYGIKRLIPRTLFIIFSIPSLIYMQVMFQVQPWKALALFDVIHRTYLPTRDLIMAMGPVFFLGLIGGILVILRRDKKLLGPLLWILSVFLLYIIFQNIPTQSPSRFTEAALHIPFGILAGYLIKIIIEWLLRFRSIFAKLLIGVVIIKVSVLLIIGILVFISMILWQKDQAASKVYGSWLVPGGIQLGYQMKEFMSSIEFLKDNTSTESIVMAYETAGNFIPAYAGHFVYYGHANTPDGDKKKEIAGEFFSGTMNIDTAKDLMKNEHISYVFFGPQERDLSRGLDLNSYYPFLREIYRNRFVVLYKVEM